MNNFACDHQFLFVQVTNTEAKTPDDVHCWLYVVNTSNEPLEIKARGDNFQTADEKTGEGFVTGSKTEVISLQPHTFAQVGEVLEWEMDGAVATIVYAKRPTEQAFTFYDFDLKLYKKTEQDVPYLNKRALVVEGSCLGLVDEKGYPREIRPRE